MPAPPAGVSTWPWALVRAQLTMLLAMALEGLRFAPSYARDFVTGRHWFGLILTWLAAAVVAALPVAVLVAFSRWAERRLGDRQPFSERSTGLRLQSAAALGVGALVALCWEGRLLRFSSPWQLVVLVAAPAVVLLSAAVLPRRVPGARASLFAAYSIVLVGYFLAEYETLYLFQTAAFGVSSRERVLRTAIVLGMPLLLLVLCRALAELPSGAQERKRGRRFVALALATSACFISGHFFVDLHPRVHAVLLFAELVLVWRVAQSIACGWLEGAKPKRLLAAWALTFLASFAFLATRPTRCCPASSSSPFTAS